MGYFSEYALEAQKHLRTEKKKEQAEFLRILMETGATPEGQLILPIHMFPPQQIVRVA